MSQPLSFGASELITKDDIKIAHPVCALNPSGMSHAHCQAHTKVVMRNHRFCCGNTDHKPCTSSDRLCRECILHPASGEMYPPADAQTGLCEFHSIVENRHKPQTSTVGYQRRVPLLSPIVVHTKLLKKEQQATSADEKTKKQEKADKHGKHASFRQGKNWHLIAALKEFEGKLIPEAFEALREERIAISEARWLSEKPLERQASGLQGFIDKNA